MLKKIKFLIAIDPGTIQCGVAGFIDEELIISKQIKLSGKSLYERLKSLSFNFKDFFKDYNDKLETDKTILVAVETPFIGHNPQAGLKLGQARGIILASAFDYNTEIIDISPQEVRKYYGVGTRAKKQDYQKIVKLEFAKHKLGEDEADAIAIGYTALGKIRNIKLYQKAQK